MRKDKLSKQNVILYFLGIIPVVWLGLLIAPCLADGLIGLVQQFGAIMQNPFRIELCEDSHVHFELYIDGKPQDPCEYVKMKNEE